MPGWRRVCRGGLLFACRQELLRAERGRTMRCVMLRPMLGIWVPVLVWLVGCDGLGGRKLPPEPTPRPAPAQDAVLAGSIGAVTYFANVTGQPARGFGVVIGLGEDGSGDCPSFIREHLIEEMEKVRDTWASLEQRRRFSPGELIDAPDTAVVEVSGVVPAGAPAAARFDVAVRAIPGTSTRSLAGGLLLPCELRLSDPTGSDEALLGGEIVARAAGPVFVNPFLGDSSHSGADSPRRGRVLSGGETTEARRLRLLLREPSYPLARRLENRINERFGQRPRVADAMSRGYLVIEAPARYATRPGDLLRLLPHLYVDDDPASTERRLRELRRLVLQPSADYEHISLAWEGIGRTAPPHIQPLYSNENLWVRFYAARAGLRLQDVTALPVLAEIARSSDHASALLAIRELGGCPYPQAALELRPLLDSPDQEIRIATYTALLNHPQSAIRSLRFRHVLDHMQLNLILDVVDCRGEPLIYVRRRRIPRIAVFGRHMPVTLPVFYSEADDSITLNAVAETGGITLFTKRRGKLSEPIVVAPRVAKLISALADLPTKHEDGSARGVGLPYSQVVRVLAALCREGTIPAHLEVERVSITELLGPEALPERPEADESPAFEEPVERDADAARAETGASADEP